MALVLGTVIKNAHQWYQKKRKIDVFKKSIDQIWINPIIYMLLLLRSCRKMAFLEQLRWEIGVAMHQIGGTMRGFNLPRHCAIRDHHMSMLLESKPSLANSGLVERCIGTSRSVAAPIDPIPLNGANDNIPCERIAA